MIPALNGEPNWRNDHTALMSENKPFLEKSKINSTSI